MLDTEESFHIGAWADPGFTSWDLMLLPSNNSSALAAIITQYHTNLLYQEALGTMSAFLSRKFLDGWLCLGQVGSWWFLLKLE